MTTPWAPQKGDTQGNAEEKYAPLFLLLGVSKRLIDISAKSFY